MATGAIVGGVLGGSMVAGGTGAAIKSMREKTYPRQSGYIYGGTQDNAQSLQDQYQGGIDQGNQYVSAGLDNLTRVGQQGANTYQVGQQILNGANTYQGMDNAAASQAIQASIPAAQQAADIGASNALGQQFAQSRAMAASGGPLAMRHALADNANAGAQVAQGLAGQKAQIQANGMQALAGEYDTGAQIGLQNQAQRIQMQGLGANIMNQGQGTQIASYSPAISAGVASQGQYLGQLQNMNDQQLQASMTYDQMRQAEARRRSQNLWNLGSGLITGGANVIGKAAGSYGGGGGGGGEG